MKTILETDFWRNMKKTTILVLPLLSLAITSSARAQSRPPFGQWAGQGGEMLFVSQNAACALKLTSGYIVQGPCHWNSTYAGGILTIFYQNGTFTNRLYENITWVNPTMITVWGEPYRRQ